MLFIVIKVLVLWSVSSKICMLVKKTYSHAQLDIIIDVADAITSGPPVHPQYIFHISCLIPPPLLHPITHHPFPSSPLVVRCIYRTFLLYIVAGNVKYYNYSGSSTYFHRLIQAPPFLLCHGFVFKHCTISPPPPPHIIVLTTVIVLY